MTALTGWAPSPRGIEQRLRAEIAAQFPSVRAFCRGTLLYDGTISPYLAGRGHPRIRMARQMMDALDCDWHHLWRLTRGQTWPTERAGFVGLKAARSAEGLTLRALHTRLGALGHRCSCSRITEWDRGQHEPSLPTVLYLSAALRRHPDDLFNRSRLTAR